GNTTSGDGCDANCTPTRCGNGIVTTGEACDDGNTADGDCCDAACKLEPAGSPCDDGDPCTNGDACLAGTCSGSVAPAAGCMSAPGGRLTLKDETPKPRQLAWTWSRGTVATGGFGDPVNGATGYVLCVYDAVGGTPALRARGWVAAGGTCGTRACWTTIPG